MKYLLVIIACVMASFSVWGEDAVAENTPEACFKPHVSGDGAASEILLAKTRAIIGRIGCGAEDAEYMIVPELDVEEVKSTSGMVRDVTLAKGTLTLHAVSADNPDMVWHSVTVPLETTVTGAHDDEVAPALARQIKVNDSVYVRFIRVARKKIAGARKTKAGDGEKVCHEETSQP